MWTRISLLLLVATIIVGCSSSRKVVIEETPPSSVELITDTMRTRSAPIRPMGRAKISVPSKVYIFRDTIRTPTFDVSMVDITHEWVDIYTPNRMHRFANVPKGERKQIFNVQSDSSGSDSLASRVEGKPETQRTEITVPKERGFFDQIRSLIWAIVALVIVGVLAKIFLR